MSIRVEMDLCLKCRTARFKGRKGNANEEKEKIRKEAEERNSFYY